MPCLRAAPQKKLEWAAPPQPIYLAVVREEEDPHPVKGRGTGREFERVSRSLWALSERIFERLVRPTIGVEVAIEAERKHEL